MGIFDKLREPIVLKEDSDAKKQLEQLNNYLTISPPAIKSQIEQDIKLLQIGLYGEEAVMFELKNSHMPMYIMHDLFFEFNGLKTQIDYLIVTRNITVIIECKNLYGNITIDKFGNFTRTVQLGKNNIKKGIYSPVTQNQRHIDMIHEIRRNEKNIFLRSTFDKYFNDNYKSIIVLANPNSVLDMRYAPKDIQNKIVKVDGLISYIKALQKNSDSYSMSDKEMKELANFFIEKSVPNNMDYTEKYKNSICEDTSKDNTGESNPTQIDIDVPQQASSTSSIVQNALTTSEVTAPCCPKCGSQLVRRTAKKGNNAGNQFYGCSNFPKCRYIQNL